MADMTAMATIEQIYRAGLRRVDGRAAVRAALQRQGDRLHVGEQEIDLAQVDRVLVIGAGKASAAMAQGLEDVLADRITAGVVTTKDGHTLPTGKIALREASHPTPDERCLTGARAMVDLLQGLTERDLVIALMSGGGSALMEALVPGVVLDDLRELTRLLLRSGAVIHEMNTIRKHISTLKGGGLARLAQRARLVNLMISDVIGDDLDTIASGPTVPDTTTFGDALDVLDRYRLRDSVPPAVLAHLQAGAAGRLPETAKPGDSAFQRVTNVLVATNELAMRAAAAEADRLGYRPLILSTLVQGEAREVAKVWAAIGLQAVRSGEPAGRPCCLLGGGEATVTIAGDGLGGRNLEMALAMAIAVAGSRGLTLASLATDGSDGPTDAVGAIVDGQTLVAASAAGLDAKDALRRNDSYTFFDRVGGIVRTGPTGTNVNDLYLALIG